MDNFCGRSPELAKIGAGPGESYQEVAVRIQVDVGGLRDSAADWGPLADEAARLRVALERAVGGAVVAAGHPLVGAQLDRLWARWGSALAARIADLEVLGQLVAETAEAYDAVDHAPLWSTR